METMEFELRPWNASDLNSLVKYANNWNIAKNLKDQFPFPYTENDGKAFIKIATQSDFTQIFAIDIDGQAVGAISIEPQNDVYRKNAELGYWLGEPFWGRGITSRAVKVVVDITFSNYEIDRIFARPFGTNILSQKILEKNNFILEAKFEKALIKNEECLDEVIYAVRRENWQK
ncbi:MAG: GNAT family protein [Bacteroidota bacterium]